MPLLVLIFSFFFAQQALGQNNTTNPSTNPGQTSGSITINGFNLESFSRATGNFFGNLLETQNTIYAGLTNNSVCSGSGLCNSCADSDGLTACNARAVHDGMNFIISISSSTAGRVVVSEDDNTTTPAQLDWTGYPKNDILAANTIVNVSIPWSEICNAIMGQNCNDPITSETTKTGRIRIGVAANDGLVLADGEYINNIQFVFADISNGNPAAAGTVNYCTDNTTTQSSAVCNFIAYPGDSKIFLESVRTGTGFPNASDADIEFLRVFYTDQIDEEPNLATSTFATLAVGSGDGTTEESTKVVSLDETEVGGLSNDVTYRFALAVVDEAQNVGFITRSQSPRYPEADPGSFLAIVDDCNANDTSAFGWEGQNCQGATPSEVLGLATDEFDCFITTATYGSPFRPKVEDFRKFRNVYLKSHWLGRRLIQFYYDNSPPVSAWIRNNPEVKPFMRGVLYPFWLFAKASLQYPIMLLLGSLLSLLAFTGLKIRKGRY